jgi:hypothetical protein
MVMSSRWKTSRKRKDSVEQVTLPLNIHEFVDHDFSIKCQLLPAELQGKNIEKLEAVAREEGTRNHL